MDEHLYKLKKDGKTVGYAKIDNAKAGNFNLYVCSVIADYNWEVSTKKVIEADSIHPFVTKDKNDNDVFAGDKIKGTVETIFEDEHPVEGYIDYMSDFCGWSLDMPDLGISVYLEVVEDIELIEDKKDA